MKTTQSYGKNKINNQTGESYTGSMGRPRGVVSIGKALHENICAKLYPENMSVFTAV
jgi:hypothetical protein